MFTSPPGAAKAQSAYQIAQWLGFAIVNVAAFDMTDPHAVVSPGGVGFDINCGVRLLRTNLTEADIEPVKEQLAQERETDIWIYGCPDVREVDRVVGG